MKKVLLALTLYLLTANSFNSQTNLTSTKSDQQLEGNLELIGRWPEGPCWTSAAYENTLYVGSGSSVKIVDITDPENPKILNTVLAEGFVYDIKVEENNAYVSMGRSGIGVFDITNPDQGFAEIFESVYPINESFVKDKKAYCAMDSYGLGIIDFTDPQNPVEIGHNTFGGKANGIAIVGNNVFVADYFYGLRIFDVLDPTNPTEIGSCQTYGGALRICVEDDLAFLADEADGLRIIDVADPTNPNEIGAANFGGFLYDAVVGGGYAYLAQGDVGITVIDITDPENPVRIKTFDTDGFVNSLIKNEFDFLFSSNSYGGLSIIEFTTPSTLVEKSKINTSGRIYKATVVDKTVLLYDEDAQLHFLNIYDPSDPKKIFTEVDLEIIGPIGLSVHENLAFVSQGDLGMTIVDLGQEEPSVICDFKWGDSYYEYIEIDGDYAFITDPVIGLHIVNISDPQNPVYVGRFSDNSVIKKVKIKGDYAFLLSANDGLKVIDISNPANPFLVSTINAKTWNKDLDISGDHAFIAEGIYGVSMIDISDPANPTILPFNYDGQVWKLLIDGDYIVAESGQFMKSISIKDATEPDPESTIKVPDQIEDIFISKKYYKNKSDSTSYIFVSAGSCGLYILQHKIIATVVNEEENNVTAFYLYDNYPNPFNPSTKIEYQIPVNREMKPVLVQLKIFDLQGKEMTTLVNEYQTPGKYQVNFEADKLSTGVYIYSLRAGGNILSRKMIYLK